jgi:anaerobic magnesium-protoporphyrin IX monomethyl ester cyclase
MSADITLVNLNMLFVRYADGRTEREKHLPLGPLYLTAALERAGFTVDFRDYQTHECPDPFTPETIAGFLKDSAPILGASCMANLLPFTLLALQDFKKANPEKTVVLGGVGSKSVEREILAKCPWIDVIARGEGEVSGPVLIRALKEKTPLDAVPGVSFMRNGKYVETPRAARLTDLDALPPPAFGHIKVRDYEGYGMITSRGCPYPCTFCSVAPVWDRETYSRSGRSVVAEMKQLHEEHGVKLFLFQDEFFVSGKGRVVEFCDELSRSGMKVKWKAFGRVNLTDEETMRAMASTGCCEIRYGIESGCDKILERTRKGFTAAEAVEVVSKAVGIFDRTDCFYIWGFPFETLEDFHQTVFQMVSFRAMGARILPSLLCLLPQTDIYREVKDSGKLEFCPQLFPEYMITGHEVLRGARCEAPAEHLRIFDFIKGNPEIFPGFFHYDLEGNVLPKLKVLQEFGFYGADRKAGEVADTDSCGAHSPRIKMARPDVEPAELATRARE